MYTTLQKYDKLRKNTTILYLNRNRIRIEKNENKLI